MLMWVPDRSQLTGAGCTVSSEHVRTRIGLCGHCIDPRSAVARRLALLFKQWIRISFAVEFSTFRSTWSSPTWPGLLASSLFLVSCDTACGHCMHADFMMMP